MKPCKGFEDRISDYAEGLLPNHFRKEIEAHFATCSRCKEAFEGIRNLKTYLRNLRTVRTSPDFDTVLHARIRMERSLSRRGFLNRPYALPAYAAVGAVVIVAAFFVFGPLQLDQVARKTTPVVSARDTYSGNGTTSGINQGSTIRLGRVKFPIDRVGIASFGTTGTALDSREAHKFSRSRSDSARSRKLRQVNSPSFEF